MIDYMTKKERVKISKSKIEYKYNIAENATYFIVSFVILYFVINGFLNHI